MCVTRRGTERGRESACEGLGGLPWGAKVGASCPHLSCVMSGLSRGTLCTDRLTQAGEHVVAVISRRMPPAGWTQTP